MGFQVTHLYGLTETYGPSLVCEYQEGWTDLPATMLAERLSRRGVPTVSVADVRVAGRQLAPVPADGRTVGEILVRSNTVAAGYLDDEQATAEAFRGGWFHTGDPCRIDEEGYLFVVDRIKHVTNTGGVLVASREVEDAIYEHDAVAEVAVVGLAHQRWIEAIAAVVVARSPVAPEELIAFARERLAAHKVPKSVHFVDELAKNASGKLLKRELRYQLNRSSAPAGR
ncbi:MAG: hypothetical protein DLM64_12745 [Solirubrobacterales bacterium]|nr:MAG: hypothetical protein DLM64_12745 [Solirubrobacterales bacterium]